MIKERLSNTSKILDLGCGSIRLNGKEHFPGYNFEGEVIGLGLDKGEHVDISIDLNKEKIPFEDKTFDMVYSHHFLEHLNNAFEIILEVHRVLKKGGYFLIRTPHISYLDSLASFAHVKLLGYGSLDFIIFGGNPELPTEKRFKLIKRKIIFGNFYKKIGIEFFANKFPNIYNGFLMGIFPARQMHWELKR